MKNFFFGILLALFSQCHTIQAQPSFKGYEHLFTDPLYYNALYINGDIVVDGNLNEKEWASIAWTSDFVDIEGTLKPKPHYCTRVKMMWNKTYLFIAAHMEEPHVWANLKNRDDVVFYDNDFEVFIDPNNNGHQYFEIEVNALNTIFDLFLPKPYRTNSLAVLSWDAPGMKTSVKVHGTLNNPKDRDKGWTVEMAIPFKAVSIGNAVQVPKMNDFWRINFSRVEWDTDIKDGKYVKKKDSKGYTLPERNWVWSPQGVINMHNPERWGYLYFTDGKSVSLDRKLPYSEEQKKLLWLIFYKQHEYFEKHGKFAGDLSDLAIDQRVLIGGFENKLKLHSSEKQFTATIGKTEGEYISINDEGLILAKNNKE